MKALYLMLAAVLTVVVFFGFVSKADATIGAGKTSLTRVTTSATPGTTVRGPTKCWDRSWTVSWLRRSTAGAKLWRYGLTIDRFCWNYPHITALQSHRFIKVYVNCCWSGEHIDEEKHWNGNWSFRRWTQGHFEFNLGIGPSVHKYPDVFFKVNGAGGLQYNADCC